MKETVVFYWLVALVVFIAILNEQAKKNKNANNNLLTYIIILVLFFSAPFTWLVITTPSCMGFIEPQHQETWLGFFGSIIGGALTIIGVWWTLSEQAKDRRNDLDNSNFPSLLFDLKYPNPKKEDFNKKIANIFIVDNVNVGDSEKNILYLPMFIINHDVPIFDLYLKKADIHIFEEEKKLYH